MLSVGIESIGDMVVFSCKGNIVRSEAASKLREAVTSQANARIIVLDLTEVHAIEADGLDMLSALQRWALDHNIQFKLFDPSASVRSRLEHNESTQFDIARFSEMIAILAGAESHFRKAA
jgi:anti-anti-sigma regulatory factor